MDAVTRESGHTRRIRADKGSKYPGFANIEICIVSKANLLVHFDIT